MNNLTFSKDVFAAAQAIGAEGSVTVGKVTLHDWATQRVTEDTISFDEGVRAAAEAIGSLGSDATGESDRFVIDVLKVICDRSQGEEAQINSNPAFTFGAVATALAKRHQILEGLRNV